MPGDPRYEVLILSSASLSRIRVDTLEGAIELYRRMWDTAQGYVPGILDFEREIMFLPHWGSAAGDRLRKSELQVHYGRTFDTWKIRHFQH